MKLKYYIKGIGVGIIFATLVLSISFAVYNDEMSEEDIIEAALDLGMQWPKRNEQKETESVDNTEQTTTESSSMSQELSSTPEEATTPKETSSGETASPNETSSEETTTPNETSSEETTPSEPATSKEADEETTSIATEKRVATISVTKGMGSHSVAKLLKNAGLIESADDFDDYIMARGYANRIRIGTYEISLGATYDEIIKIICGLK